MFNNTIIDAIMYCSQSNFPPTCSIISLILVQLLCVSTVDHVRYVDCSDGEVRLSNVSSGRTELCYGNMWFGICSDTWHYKSDAAVKTVCSSLGYSEQSKGI